MLVLPWGLGFFELGNWEPVRRLGVLLSDGTFTLPQGGLLAPAPFLQGTKGKAGWPCHSGPFWQPRTSLCDCWPASAPALQDCTPCDSPGLWRGRWLVCPWAGRGCPVGLLLPGWLPSFLPSFLPRQRQATRGGSLSQTQLYSVWYFFKFGI